MIKRRYLYLAILFSLFLPINFLFFGNQMDKTEELITPKAADAQSINYEWLQIVDQYNYSYGYDLAIDDSNNIYVIGYLSGGKGLLVKYNPFGLYRWNKTFPGVSSYSNSGNLAITIDSENNVYIAGLNGSMIFLLKVNQSGDTQWQEEWGGARAVVSVEINSNDEIFVLGTTISYGAGQEDIVLIKYNNSGGFQWYETWGYDWDERAYDMVIDSGENIYIVGTTTRYHINRYDICVIKYDSSGTQIFNTSWSSGGSSYWETGESIAVDSSNNIYVSGRISGDSPLLLLKFDSLGNYVWNSTKELWNYIVTTGIPYIGESLILDHSENLIVSYFNDGDMVIGKYDRTGQLISEYSWDAGLFGQPSTDYSEVGTSLVEDPFTNIFITGFIKDLSQNIKMFLMKCNADFDSNKEKNTVFSDEKKFSISFYTNLELDVNTYYSQTHQAYITFNIDGYNDYFLIYVYDELYTRYIRMDIMGDGEYSFEVEPYKPYNFTYNNNRRFRVFFNYSYTYESCTLWDGIFCTGSSIKTESGEYLSDYFSISKPSEPSIPGYKLFLLISALSLVLITIKEKIKRPKE